MKKFAFISDFDGTLSAKDFYHIIIDKYLGREGKEFYTEWKRTKKINVEFLNKIFGSVNLSEKQLFEEITKIPIDAYAGDFINRVRKSCGDFYIVSAGTSYYIKILLEYLGIKDVQVISMEGVYSNGGIKIMPDSSSLYYSDVFGLDKRKFVESIKKDYEYIIFAGDSEPDLGAAKAADIVYARGELVELLRSENISFTAFSDFKQIENDLIEKGYLE
ncbi:MtnX-like HAD-IB family phosphatase [Acetivibrio cellulolyticus]|uniref:MtnX-like HAD-IB family phosphatase n=1 Tax=Acetivibrio cellulolyticus TaxID=35830 RepID=UPI0001E2D4AB|nr:MtnX-like HAD-IB family phosphatase [Acetivibrio cellulolyticus]